MYSAASGQMGKSVFFTSTMLFLVFSLSAWQADHARMKKKKISMAVRPCENEEKEK